MSKKKMPTLDAPRKILIANRGEIAIRVARSVRECGHIPVAIFSDADATSPHVRSCDEAYRLPGNLPAETYLDIEAVLRIAKQAKVDAIHPGYGFLSENATFSKACADQGIIFIGPDAKTIADMGDKVSARILAKKAGLRTLSGSDQAKDAADAKAQADAIGYPVLLKAKAGGGGKGMRRVDTPDQLEESFRLAQSEALKAFNDGTLYVEKFLTGARHVEVQVFADTWNHAFAIGDRDCSVQRRHQKVIEEAPAPGLSDETRAKMAKAAIDLALSVQYVGAGTLEFLVDRDENFFFLEMNTRLQVEHPVTEWVFGVDLVAMQIEAAFGKNFESFVVPAARGHAIEVRLYAEDPDNNFFPVPGTLHSVSWPTGPGVRVDTGVESKSTITLFYDPMIAKISTHGPSRDHARTRMLRALGETKIAGTKTNQGFLRGILEHPAFASADLSTQFIADHGPFHATKLSEEELFAALVAITTPDSTLTTSPTSSLSPWWTQGLPGVQKR